GGAAGHRDDVLAEQGTEDQVVGTERARDREALLPTDERVVVDGAPVGEVLLPGLEAQVASAALGVGQTDPLARLEGSSADAGRCGRLIGAHPRSLRGPAPE